MPATLTPRALLTDLTGRGFTVRAVHGQVSVVPASRLTPQDRQAIREARNGLLAVLSPGEPWNPATGLWLISEADTLVTRLGVDGRHPEIGAAAATVVSAFATLDLETVRFAVAEFSARVRKVAAERVGNDVQSVPVGT